MLQMFARMVSPELLSISIPASEHAPAHRLSCLRFGNSAAPRTLVCVHGLTRNAHDFDFLAAALANDYCILCLDMAGRGGSEWLSDPANYNYATYVYDCKTLLAALGKTRVDWLGTSMGGIIGMMLANDTPELIRSLVLNDIGCLVPESGLKRIATYVGKHTRFTSIEDAYAVLRPLLAPFGLTSDGQWQHMLHYSLQNEPDGTVRLAYDPAIAAAFSNPDAIKDVDLWPLWKAVTALPVLLIHGAQSDILSAHTASTMQGSHPNCTLYTVPNAGHAPSLMDDAHIAFIRQWLHGH